MHRRWQPLTFLLVPTMSTATNKGPPSHPVREWLVLDTDVTRHTVQGRSELGIDLAALARAKDRLLLSISEVAYLELVDDLTKGNISIKEWRAFAMRVHPLLDPDYPVIPNGRGLAAMLGIERVDYDLSQSQRSAWHALRSVRRRKDLQDGRSVMSDGVRRVFRPREISRVLQEVEAKWVGLFAEAESRAEGPVVAKDRREVRDAIRTTLGADVARRPELELVIAATVERLIQHGRGYRPKLNDALDYEHLYMVGLPAIVCTSDSGFRNFARGLGVLGSDRIKSPAEVLEMLGT